MASSPDKVLIVDDEPAVRVTLEMALSGEDLAVTTAIDAEVADEILERESFALLITDKNLPGMTGIDLIRKMRGRGDDTPVLLITAHASRESALDTMNLGVHGFLEKPFPDIFAVVDRAKEAIAAGRSATGRTLVKASTQASQHFDKASAVLASASKALGRLRILIANPDPGEQQWLADHLSHNGDEVIAIDSASELLRQVDAGSPDCVLLDREVGKDLLVVLAKLRATCPQAVLMVTACEPTLNEIIELIDLGVRAVVEKPLATTAFEDKVGGLLQALRSQQATDVLKRR